MLEGLVAWVLNTYLGKYVQLNTDQLSIALLSGKVELENLPLKKDALQYLGLPVVVKSGFIGKVHLQIPVRQIRSAPWVIAIEQLYLVASPLSANEWDHDAEDLARHEQKLGALDVLEAKWRLKKDVPDSNTAYYASSYSSWFSYGAGLVSEIIENLQLRIQDIHIRYEDSTSIPSQTIAFGITLHSLIAQSCDSNWLPGFIHTNKNEEAFKLVELQKFAIYWMNLNEGESLSNLSLAELAEAVITNRIEKNIRNYIIPSVSAQAHLKRNRSTRPLRTSAPRIGSDLLLEEVNLILSDWQYNQIVACIRGLENIERLRRYHQYKPVEPIKNDARAWWLYAISCEFPDRQPAICRPRPTWESCLKRAKENVKYVQICKKLLTTPTLTLTAEEKKMKDAVEWNREYDELKVLRELAMRSVDLPVMGSSNSRSAGQSMLVNWFPTWMGWYSSAESSSTTVPETSQLEGEILQVLSDSAEYNTIFKRDAVFGQFSFCLKSGTLSLCTADSATNESVPMLELEYKNLSLSILSKPRTNSHLVELCLGALFLRDRIAQNTVFPILIGPPGLDRTAFPRSRGLSPRVSFSGMSTHDSEDIGDNLFYLAYEKKPPNSGCDFRLSVKSKCLDVVYQPNALRWLTEFIYLPHQRDITQSQIEAMKTRTKKELMKNWEHILEGRVVNRTSWDLELDITAPQIIFVEQFSDQNSAMAVIDFGKLQLRNNVGNIEPPDKPEVETKEGEDSEMFLTPCSTPPASEASDSGDQTINSNFPINETNIHNKLYDRYALELTDMQILLGKAKDNWRYALNKGFSNLHVLDRFSISLQIERRVVNTADPHFPSLTVNANLPRLAAHLNENKITSARNLLQLITATGLPSPFKTSARNFDIDVDVSEEDESVSADSSIEQSKLVMMQFTVDQLSLEIQSRGRSISELQVAGVKAAFTKRPVDISIALTVHSLLVVDALQTFGPDFELLIASHKHVGMDSMSGSIRDSEPTSPTSPGSPDPSLMRYGATSPIALTQALSTLATSPPLRWSEVTKNDYAVDTEALISIEVVLITGQEPLQIANIQFNNLDVIANQETIVELIGFVRRSFPSSSQKPSGITKSLYTPFNLRESTESLSEESTNTDIGSTEITFDFHRLNILLLRGVVRDGYLYGKKICTATMSEAKIRATVGSKLEVGGSLGGLQVLDLTPEGQMHQRIVSVGQDPLVETVPLLGVATSAVYDDNTAFSFKVTRTFGRDGEEELSMVNVKMASLWYTHSPYFTTELQFCANEFKQYLSNLARSIKTAATDMALGLVQARATALAHTLNMSKKIPSSMYGSAVSFSESASPNKRKRRRSGSNEQSGYASAKDSMLQTPYSPEDLDDLVLNLKLNIELDSPVLVLPRSNSSAEVFIAHLGKISISNNYSDDIKTNIYNDEYSENRIEHYNIEVKDMNVYSLDTGSRRVPSNSIIKSEVLYDCRASAKPILHNTKLKLSIDRELCKLVNTRHGSESNLLLDGTENETDNYINPGKSIQITGSIVTALKLSLTRHQYEQILDTLEWFTSSPQLMEAQGISRLPLRAQSTLTDINEEDIGVSTLNMDPNVRAKLFPIIGASSNYKKPVNNSAALKIIFNIPVFTIELRGENSDGEQGLVDLSFQEFVFNYEKSTSSETNIQISLRSILMEDLHQPVGSKQRAMVSSTTDADGPPNSACVSRSCPDVTYREYLMSASHGSLPDHLEAADNFVMETLGNSNFNMFSKKNYYPSTPPPSPQGRRCDPEKNLVIISILLVDSSVPNIQDYNGNQKSVSVDFNCLDLVINTNSWIVVLDFFNISSGSGSSTEVSNTNRDTSPSIVSKEKSVTNISVKSLTVVLIKPDRDIAKVNLSKVEIEVKTKGMHKEVYGKLGSMSLQDLTLNGQLYKERFMTSGKQALQFQYVRHLPDSSKNYDAQLTLDMASVVYVHTKRFVAEILAFFKSFTEQQEMVMKGIQAATSGQPVRLEHFRLSLRLEARSPMILLPVSSKSSDVLVVDLGQLSVTNVFKFSGDDGTISVLSNNSDKQCLLDVMTIKLENMDLYAGVKDNSSSPVKSSVSSPARLKLGTIFVTKDGPSLLTKKFQLKLQVEKNLDVNESHAVPDMSIYGHLSTLDGALDLKQYRLIRGLLDFNLGEDTEMINPSVPVKTANAEAQLNEDWKLSSIKLDMQNVTLCLLKTHNVNSPLARIDFIKSHLTVETYSNFCQDVDLVSREILIIDSRFSGSEPNGRRNVFTNILQPINQSNDENIVQAEIHSRKRQDHMNVTILLNDIRLIAIIDWWESVREYIFQNVPSSDEDMVSISENEDTEDSIHFDLKLNITDSEIVIVEDSSQRDTNSVILKSTTVLQYRPYNLEKPLSCSLSKCEMFSCILEMKDETALSIIDPVTLNIEMNKENLLEVQLQFLMVRLSYHDMCMFMKIINSLPKQIFSQSEENPALTEVIQDQISTLTSLGFQANDCLTALEKSGNRIDDAAIWLTLNAIPSHNAENRLRRPFSIDAVEVKASRISVCIIDDCGDSDVPLLELSLSKLCLYQLLPKFSANDYVHPKGFIEGHLESDYYNRVLSGWEPFLEPWKCKISWERIISQVLWKNRLSIKVESEEPFNINVTSTIIELYKQVKDNWTKDYYNIRRNKDDIATPRGVDNFRRRSPFVPFALKNDTGSHLKFQTFISDLDKSQSVLTDELSGNWISVGPGELVPFSFTTRDKMRHQDSHKMRMHQLGVKVDGWQSLEPVTVDRVGVYFRDAPTEIQSRVVDISPARVVFDITLEGSARKLVTIRSALLISNYLPQTVEVKLESQLPQDSFTQWVPSKSFTIDTKATLAVPLVHTHSQINIRPNGSPHQFTFCMPTLSWTRMPSNTDRMYELATCHTHKGHNYRFCAEIVRENLFITTRSRIEQPAHRIHLLPTVKLENLLPIDIHYVISGEVNLIKAGSSAALTAVDPEKIVELEVRLDNFRTCNSVVVPIGCSSDFTCRIRLEDNRQRKLYLLARVTFNKAAKLRITISAYYWIINRTGLPLVFRQSGTSLESAGQFDEHEQARMVSPLLFSFSDQDASPTINARVGKRVVSDGTPQWCSNFHVQKGTQYRKLHVTMRDGRADTVFIVGLEVRPGRGKYRSTSIITISPRYQLYNRSLYKLLFAQICSVRSSTPSHTSYLKALPNSHMPFHWSNLEKEQLLCVSIEDIQNCCWSGGLKIDTNNSMHVNIRDNYGHVYFLRLEVLLQGATFFIVFSDADTMPPPIRVDNFSEVSIMFGQSCYIDFMHSTARAHTSVPYAWDEPTKPHSIRLVAPGGVSNNYDMSGLGSAPGLTYENFIYIAFAGTFRKPRGIHDPNDVESQELVLDVVKNTRVVLSHKIPSERSQLWRMTTEGYLQHEGSNPPLHPGQTQSRNSILVLDIEGTAPQPNTNSRLMLRRIDPRRQSTQKWRFTDDGKLCCDHYNMCVQAADGFYGLRPGNAAVLGLPLPECHKFTEQGIPIEHAIERQRLRPGSGFLSVSIQMDGPTQVISIKDLKEKKVYASPDDREWGSISQDQRPKLSEEKSDTDDDCRELQITINLRGLGVSLVCRKPAEELVYAYFSTIIGETLMTSQSKQFCISIKHIQVDNQLMDTSVPVVMYITPVSSKNSMEAYDHLPALDFNTEIQKKVDKNAVIFKHFILRLKKITIVIEERLLLKLCQFIGVHSQMEEVVNQQENDYNTQRLLSEVSAVHAKRYYFGVIKLIPDQIRLSVTTASKLPENLQRIKRKLGLTLIKFEDAAVDLEAFERQHPFETSQFLFKSIIKHFKDELMWQAGIILGSVDFIGNPLGLVNDVSEGISGFIYEGNVGALVKNVTHGMSNSAAKITESLSDGLGKVTMDDYHEEMRQKIRQVQTGKSSDHILAGFKGLGFGILGGATGIFKQVYEGASNDGIQGVFSGLGKGLVGAVTKPVVGVLDLASETARAVRDSSRSKLVPERVRLPRCPNGPGSLLPKYDFRQSKGQQYLYALNGQNFEEHLVAFQGLGSASEDIFCIVSDKMIRIVTSTRSPDLTPVIECALGDLEICNVITEKKGNDIRYYIEIVMHYAGVSAVLVNTDPVKKPRVRCQTSDMAHSVSQQINYARRMYIEHLYTLTSDNISTLED